MNRPRRFELIIWMLLPFLLILGSGSHVVAQEIGEGEEPQVYQVLINEYLLAGDGSQIIVDERTTSPGAFGYIAAARIAGVSPDLVEDFKRQNNISACLELPSEELDPRIKIISDSARRTDGGDETGAVSSGAPLLVEFSRIGFSPDMDQALVYVIISCGRLCGSHAVIYLRKEAGEWKVIHREVVAES